MMWPGARAQRIDLIMLKGDRIEVVKSYRLCGPRIFNFKRAIAFNCPQCCPIEIRKLRRSRPHLIADDVPRGPAVQPSSEIKRDPGNRRCMRKDAERRVPNAAVTIARDTRRDKIGRGIIVCSKHHSSHAQTREGWVTANHRSAWTEAYDGSSFLRLAAQLRKPPL